MRLTRFVLRQSNLDEVRTQVSEAQWRKFRFLSDIRSLERCRAACADVDYVLHHAAQVKTFVYAASSASIQQASEVLGYAPCFDFTAGLARALPWYVRNADRA